VTSRCAGTALDIGLHASGVDGRPSAEAATARRNSSGKHFLFMRHCSGFDEALLGSGARAPMLLRNMAFGPPSEALRFPPLAIPFPQEVSHAAREP
jgi:hypothetical protein